MALVQLARLVVAGAAPGAASAAAGLPQAAAAGRHLLRAFQQQQQAQQCRGFAVVSGDDSHDDFKPQYKGEAVDDAAATIKGDITSNQVFIYMKGSPDAPQCGFSNMACRILDAYDFKYGSRNVLADAGIREGIKTFTGWPTIPQVFVKGEFIGGSDILMEMHKAGELTQLAEELQQQQGGGTGGASGGGSS